MSLVPALTDQEGAAVQDADSPTGDGGIALNQNFDTLNSRIGQSNYSAGTVPGTGDDAAHGYSVGSRWLYNGVLYTCIDATTSAAVWTSSGSIGSVGISIDGGGSAITTGVKGYLVVPYAGKIISWSLVGDVTGSIVVNVWKIASGSALPTLSNKITASAPPILSSAKTAIDQTSLTGWTTSVAAFDIFGFNVDSCSTTTKTTLTLKITKQ